MSHRSGVHLREREHEHRLRGSQSIASERIRMRFVGIDVAAERHVVAVVDETDRVLFKATPFGEDVDGYTKLFEVLGGPTDALVAMEATGHYWKNLFAALVAAGFAVALLNPLRTRRFAGEDLQRTQTDAIDAVGIARFAAQKRPSASRLPDRATEELRELVRFRDRLRQDFGDRVRQLHRLVDLGFPEFTRQVRDLGSELATALLREYPTAAAFTASRCVAGPPSATMGATKSARTSPPP
jgi:transposase